MKLAPAPKFRSVQEGDDRFLALFPHRHDYIRADHPHPDHRPNWQTESRYPLSDRLVKQGDNRPNSLSFLILVTLQGV